MSHSEPSSYIKKEIPLMNTTDSFKRNASEMSVNHDAMCDAVQSLAVTGYTLGARPTQDAVNCDTTGRSEMLRPMLHSEFGFVTAADRIFFTEILANTIEDTEVSLSIVRLERES